MWDEISYQANLRKELFRKDRTSIVFIQYCFSRDFDSIFINPSYIILNYACKEVAKPST